MILLFSVSLAKSVIYIQGVVTDWSPDHLAGIVQTDSRELVVRRKDFVPGGFVGNIVGKIVQFQEEDNGGSCVSVLARARCVVIASCRCAACQCV